MVSVSEAVEALTEAMVREGRCLYYETRRDCTTLYVPDHLPPPIAVVVAPRPVRVSTLMGNLNG